MHKYIIKNCPAFNARTRQCRGAYSNYIEYQYCSGNDNCLLKQIVEICTVYRNMHAITLEDYARREVALKVLEKLEIEEVNE